MDVPVNLEVDQTQTRMVLAEIPLREGELAPTVSQNGRLLNKIVLIFILNLKNIYFRIW